MLETATIRDQSDMNAFMRELSDDFNEVDLGPYMKQEALEQEKVETFYFQNEVDPNNQPWGGAR